MLAICLFTINGFAQKQKSADIKNLIESRHFTFVAQDVTPLSGPTRILTTPYDMTVNENKIDTYLPYYGVAYIAPINPTEGGVNFTSTNFNYVPKPIKRGWEILIKPHDVNDVRQLILEVTTSGNATLQVLSNNRQAISYHGYITDVPIR
jgi:Domain of unknown function (DUF4251)